MIEQVFKVPSGPECNTPSDYNFQCYRNPTELYSGLAVYTDTSVKCIQMGVFDD